MIGLAREAKHRIYRTVRITLVCEYDPLIRYDWQREATDVANALAAAAADRMRSLDGIRERDRKGSRRGVAAGGPATFRVVEKRITGVRPR